QILHRCNNRACVNVFRHLYLGTQKDNMRQAGKDGRMRGSKPIVNPPQQRAERMATHTWYKGMPWEDRFWAKVVKSEDAQGCWLWTASIVDGYGTFKLHGRAQGA